LIAESAAGIAKMSKKPVHPRARAQGDCLFPGRTYL